MTDLSAISLQSAIVLTAFTAVALIGIDCNSLQQNTDYRIYNRGQGLFFQLVLDTNFVTTSYPTLEKLSMGDEQKVIIKTTGGDAVNFILKTHPTYAIALASDLQSDGSPLVSSSNSILRLYFLWYIEDASDGYCRIRCDSGNRMMDGRSGEGVTLGHWTSDPGNPNQEWAFLPVRDQILAACALFIVTESQRVASNQILGTEVGSVETAIDCGKKCVSEEFCYAFSYEPAGKLCRLTSGLPNSVAFETASESDAYGISFDN